MQSDQIALLKQQSIKNVLSSIPIDHARKRGAKRRGGKGIKGIKRLSLDVAEVAAPRDVRTHGAPRMGVRSGVAVSQTIE